MRRMSASVNSDANRKLRRGYVAFHPRPPDALFSDIAQVSPMEACIAGTRPKATLVSAVTPAGKHDSSVGSRIF